MTRLIAAVRRRVQECRDARTWFGERLAVDEQRLRFAALGQDVDAWTEAALECALAGMTPADLHDVANARARGLFMREWTADAAAGRSES